MLGFKYNGKEYQIEVEPFKVTVFQFRAVAVCGDERIEIPGAVSDFRCIAEGLALLTVALYVEKATI